MKVIAMILFGLIFIVVVWALPLSIIWSLNTLFALGIDYTKETWLAALVLGGLTAGPVSISRARKQ